MSSSVSSNLRVQAKQEASLSVESHSAAPWTGCWCPPGCPPAPPATLWTVLWWTEPIQTRLPAQWIKARTPVGPAGHVRPLGQEQGQQGCRAVGPGEGGELRCFVLSNSVLDCPVDP